MATRSTRRSGTQSAWRRGCRCSHRQARSGSRMRLVDSARAISLSGRWDRAGQGCQRVAQRLPGCRAWRAPYAFPALRAARVDEICGPPPRVGAYEASARTSLARTGHGGVVAAAGDPGVGKSRLLYEFKVIAGFDTKVLEAFSVSTARLRAIYRLSNCLRTILKLRQAMTSASVRKRSTVK
jgi:hypothetical protein